MEKEDLIIEAAALVHEDWCKQELEAFYNRANKIYREGQKTIVESLRDACYKGETKRNEIIVDVPLIQDHELKAEICLNDFESFMNMVNLGAIEVKRFTPRNLTEEEQRKKSFDRDYNSATKEENILKDFKYLSTDSQKENLQAAISAFTVFEELSKAGISLQQMTENNEVRNLIGVGIHTDWMKRNPNHPNEGLKVSYAELDDWTKQQDLTVFDALIKVVKKNNVIISKEQNVSIPDYLLEEQNVLENLKKNRK